MALDNKTVNKRIVFIVSLMFLFFMILISRLIYLQIYKYEDLKSKAELRQRRPINLAKKRGLIIDRNGNTLALDNLSVSLFAFPKEYKKTAVFSEMAKKLSPILDEKPDKVEKLIKTRHFTWLKRQISISKLEQIKALKIPGINFAYESKRVYPKKELAASLLGYTGIDNQGLAGIEHSFDNYLTLKTEQEKIFLDAMGSEVLRRDQDINPSTTSKVKTNKVRLTLDENVQYISERELKKGVNEYKAQRGLVIVMDIENGDLLSLATYPTYDPNNYSKSKWDVIKNWAVTDFYEPGSTMKIFSLSAALELKKVSIDESISCPGLIKIESWSVHDHGMSANQVRSLKPIDIIRVSSNVGTSIITRRLTPQQHRTMLLKMGFGKPTDSKLSGEVAGIIPELPWRPSQQSAISFGQSIAVTPLQLVTAMSAIAREGIRIEPRIIKNIQGIDGKIIKNFKSKEVRVLSKDTADKMRNLMIGVIEDKHGTGRDAKIPGYVMAGKTGTADKVEKGRYRGNVMSSFLGYFPAEKPKIIAFVLLDSPQTAHFASMTAVPIFKEIASNVLIYLNIPPSKPEELIDKDKKESK